VDLVSALGTFPTIEAKLNDAFVVDPYSSEAHVAFCAPQAIRLRHTKQSSCVKLWPTKIRLSNRTSVLVAKEIVGKNSTTEFYENMVLPAVPGRGAVGRSGGLSLH